MFSRGSSRAAVLGRRGVHGQTEVDVPRTGVPGLAPGGPVGLEVDAQLRDVQVAHPDEQRQSGPPDPGKRLRRVRRHPQRRVRELVRPRRHHRVRDPVEPALVGEGLALPRLAEDRQRLLEARLALPVRDAEGVVGRRGAAATDAEVEAAAAEMVDGRDLLGNRGGDGSAAAPSRPCRCARAAVLAARKLASAIGADCTDRTGVKWISPSHTPSRPQASAASVSSTASWKAAASLVPRRRSSTKIPKCMTCAQCPNLRATVKARAGETLRPGIRPMRAGVP